MNDNLKILILSCSTGEGHNSAARALEAELCGRNICCEVKDTLSFKGEGAQGRAGSLYSAVITRFPWLFGLVCGIGRLYDDLRLPSPVYAMNASYADSLYDYIRQNKFNCVICTHLFAMEAMTAVREREKIRCYGVLTDYTAIPFYKDTELDGYFVSDGHVKEMLVKKGIGADKVHCTGIPVHPRFNAVYDRAELRERLGIPADKKLIAVMTGGAGCGKIVKLCRRLDRAADENHIIEVFYGRNKKLGLKLVSEFGGNRKFRLIPFTDDIDLHVKCADIAITKPGGLSSTELAVCNIPIVHLHSVPGVETANLAYFSANGLSLGSRTVAGAVNNTLALLGDVGSAAAMRKIQGFYINGHAASAVIVKIEEEKASERIFMATVHNGRISFGQRDVLQNYTEACDAPGYM